MNTLDSLIRYFEGFPGVGARQAKRFAFHVLRMGEADAKELARLVKRAPSKVNLIMYNPVEGTDFRSSDEPTLDAFIGELVRRRVRVTVRRSRGQDIDAACGQLKTTAEKKSRAQRDREAAEAEAEAAAG